MKVVLTKLVHDLLADVVRPGDWTLDATAGNGQDTVALAKLVGPTGRVIALDCQDVAVARTKLAVVDMPWVAVHCLNHADLEAVIPPAAWGQFTGITFNLGYLPGCESAITTTSTNTKSALQLALGQLLPGGILTVIAYRGHIGAREEFETVKLLVSELDSKIYAVHVMETHGPALWDIHKRRSDQID